MKRQGRAGEALRLFDQCLAEKPDYLPALFHRAKTLFDLGRYAEAVKGYEAAMALDPENPGIREQTALALVRTRAFDRAVKLAKSVVRKAPDRASGYAVLGEILNQERQKEASVQAFEKALDLAPDFPAIWVNKGNVHRQYGELEKARVCYDEALRREPRLMAAHRLRTSLYTYGAADPHYRDLTALARRIGEIPVPGRIQLHYAMGKVLQDMVQYDEAFSHFLEGSRLKRRVAPYREGHVRMMFEKIKQAVDKAFVDAASPAGYESDLPVFIVGMPRSGTTLIEQILSGHPAVFGAGELEDLAHVFSGWNISGILNFSPSAYPAYRNLSSPSDRGRAYCRTLERFAGPGVRHVIDKLPDNFLYIGLIRAVLPRATIIHCRRDPADTCLSCFQTLFTHSQAWSYDLEELGRYHRMYLDLMAHWKQVLPPGELIELDYENVVRDVEGTTRFLLDRMGLEWDPGCRDFFLRERPVTTASVAQVRRPVYTSSVRRWRRYESHLGPLLETLRGRE